MDPLDRYSSPQMTALWDLDSSIQIGHALWINIAVAQAQCGLPIGEEDLTAYRAVQWQHLKDPAFRAVYAVELLAEEQTTHHETVARLRVFDKHAGNRGKIHLGLTSSDISENSQQEQILLSARLLQHWATGLTETLGRMANQYARVPLAGRTHNRPAQPTTLGHRFARWADELSNAVATLHQAAAVYPRRGLRGAVGTNADLLALLGGDHDALAHVQRQVWGDRVRYGLTGQSYPRSWDLPVVSAALGLCAPLGSLAATLRLMTGLDLAREPRLGGQVGSSAMPHKANPILAERVEGLQTVARGYHSMLVETCGRAWNEGDVSDSSTRRVALPGLFRTVDGLLQTADHLLRSTQINTEQLGAEVDHYRLDLLTGQLLAAAVAAGGNREICHAKIAACPRVRLMGQLGGDPQFPLSGAEISEVFVNTDGTGAAAAEAVLAHRRVNGHDA